MPILAFLFICLSGLFPTNKCNPCFIESKLSETLCLACDFEYNIAFADSWPGGDSSFQRTECIPMRNRKNLEVYISPVECLPDFPCNGSAEYPFDNLVKAFKYGWKSNAAKITFYLLSDNKSIDNESSDHFVNQQDYVSDYQYLFRRFYADIYLAPLYCYSKMIQGCIKNMFLKPTIYIRVQSLYIFIAKTFIINNIIFDGSEIQISLKNFIRPESLRKRICTDDELSGKTKPGGICDLNGVYVDIPKNEVIYGLFNLEIPIDCETCITGTGDEALILNNSEFKYFHSFEAQYSLASLITVQGIGFGIYFYNCSISRLFFPSGIINNIAMPPFYHDVPSNYYKAKLSTVKYFVIFELSSIIDYNFFKVRIREPKTNAFVIFLTLYLTPFDIKIISSVFSGSENVYLAGNSTYFTSIKSNTDLEPYGVNITILNCVFMNLKSDYLFWINRIQLVPSYSFARVPFKILNSVFANNTNSCFNLSLTDVFFYNNSINSCSLTSCSFFTLMYGHFMGYNNYVTQVMGWNSGVFLEFKGPIVYADKTIFDVVYATNMSFYEAAELQSNFFSDMNIAIISCNNVLSFFLLKQNSIGNIRNDKVNLTRAKVERDFVIENNKIFNITCLILFHHESFKNITIFNNTLTIINISKFMQATLYSPSEPFGVIKICENIFSKVNLVASGFIIQEYYQNTGLYHILSDNIVFDLKGSKDESFWKISFSAGSFGNNIFYHFQGLTCLTAQALSTGNQSMIFKGNILLSSEFSAIDFFFTIFNFQFCFIIDSFFIGSVIRSTGISSVYAVSQNGAVYVGKSGFLNLSAINSGALMLKLWKTQQALIENCFFMNNQGIEYAGDITIEFSSKSDRFLGNFDLWVTGTFGIISNIFLGSKGGKGGAIAVLEGSQILTKFNIFFAGIADQGGAIFTRQETEIFSYKDLASKATSLNAGGFLFIVGAVSLITDLIVFGCSSLKGGGIYTEGSELEIFDCLFYFLNSSFGSCLYSQISSILLKSFDCSYNFAKGDGGALYIKWGALVILKAIFDSSRALNNGGSFYLEALSYLVVKKIILAKCLAEGDGVIYVIGLTNINYYFEEILCERNIAIGKGNCFCLLQGNFRIRSVKIKNCSVDYCAVCLLSSVQGLTLNLTNLEIAYSNFKKNGLEVSGSILVLKNLTFDLSSFSPKFEFIKLTYSYMNLKNVHFEGGPKGLRFLSAEDSDMDLDIITMKLNNSMGGISAKQCNAFSIFNLTIHKANSDSEEDSRGGCLNLIASKFSITDSIFAMGRSPQGGAIVSDESDIIIENTYFINNFAELIGSDIYSTSSVDTKKNELSIKSCVFLGAPGIRTSKIKSIKLHATYAAQTIKDGESSFKMDDGGSIIIESTYLLGFRHSAFSPLEIKTFEKGYCNLSILNVTIRAGYSLDSGGALSIDGNINSTIKNSLFINNTSNQDGGAIYLNVPRDCCSILFLNSSFIFNKAKAYGNIMKIMDLTPVILIYDSFTGQIIPAQVNTSDYSSYPNLVIALDGTEWNEDSIRKVIQSYKDGTGREELEKNFTFSEFASGQVIGLTCVVVDHFLNIMYLDYSGKIAFQNSEPQKQVLNFDNEVAKVMNGVAVFENLILVAEPGFNYSVTIKYSNENSRYELSQQITFYSRRCRKGEIYSGMKCEICPKNFYSLSYDPIKEKKSSCDPCKENSICLGGNLIIPVDGYWKRDENQTLVFKCRVADACTGGNFSSNYYSNGGIQSFCKVPYTGNLCFNCIEGYGKSETNICKSCALNDTFLLKFISLVFFSLTVSLYQIWSFFDYKQNKNSTKSRCLIKLLVDHFTFIGLIYRFKIDWAQMIEIFLSFNEFYLMSIPAMMLEFDCFLNDVVKYDQKFYVNSILISLSPFFYGLVTFFSIYALKLIYRGFHLFIKKVRKITKNKSLILFLKTEETPKTSPGFRQNFYVTCLIIFYNFYPRLQMNGMLWVQCSALDDSGKPYLENNPEIICWDREHIFFVLTIALPTLAGWSIGIPLLLFYTTRKMKRTSPKREIKKYQSLLLYLTLDYKDKYYYWDSFSYLSKFLIVFCSMATNGLEVSSQGALLIFVMLGILLAHEYFKPYKFEFLNNMFSLSYIIVICTGAFSIMASAKGLKESQREIYVTGLILTNVLFYATWFILFLKNGVDWIFWKRMLANIMRFSKVKLNHKQRML